MPVRNLPVGRGCRGAEAGVVGAVRGQVIGLHPLLDYLIPVHGINGVIALSLKVNCGNHASRAAHGIICRLALLGRTGATLRLSCNSGRLRGRGLVLQARMYAYRGEDIGICRPHDHRHCRARRHARDIDPVGIDGPLGGSLLDRLDNTRDDSRLAAAARLISGLKPVPTLQGIIGARLLRIDYDKLVLVRQSVHLGAIRKICGRLRAAV